jgi:ABC-type branched-subunit amino acid transport system substrate-binding protein
MAAVAPIINTEKLIAMNVCTGAERIWDLSGQRVFHAQMSADEESRQNARVMWERGIKRVVILYVEQEYALAHERAFTKAFPGEVVASLSFTGVDIDQVKHLLLKLKTLQYDALYIPIVEPFFLGVLTHATNLKVRPKNVFSVFSFQLPEVLAAEGKNAEGVIYSYPVIPAETSAGEYFARTGTRLFVNATTRCVDDLDCVRKQLLDSGEFDDHGFLRGTFVWKTLRDGQFVALP